MNAEKFVELQFVSLREEIKETKARIFYIAAIGLFILPGGEYLARTLDAPIVELFLPLLVVCVGFLYLSENHALMRCGRYVRTTIETRFDEPIGWEHWLESQEISEPRSVDRLLGYAFYILLGAYYVGAALLGCVAVDDLAKDFTWSQTASDRCLYVLIIVYVVAGAVSACLLRANLRSSTTTELDPSHVPSKQHSEPAQQGVQPDGPASGGPAG